MTDEYPRLKRPLLEDRDDEVDPSLVEAVPDLPDGRAMQAMELLAARRGSGFGRFAIWVFSTLVGFVASVWAWRFVTGLFAANTVLGGFALVLMGTAVLVALVMAAGEVQAFSRLRRLDVIRAEAEQAASSADIKAARGVVGHVLRLYAGRQDLAWGRARLEERQAEVMDADALLALTEAEMVAPLDAMALREVEVAARRVAMVTALVPLALADLVTALVSNLRMIRRVAEIYGGRSGTLGSWRLLRRVFVSLVAAGAVALTDDMLGTLAGGGILSKLSRRFGEGVVNGALTVRVGLAAMDLCRPLPWIARPRPGVSATVSRALAGLFGREG